MVKAQESFTHSIHGVANIANKLGWVLAADGICCFDLVDFQWHDVTACTSVNFHLCTLSINLDFDKRLFRGFLFLAVDRFDDIRVVVRLARTSLSPER